MKRINVFIMVCMTLLLSTQIFGVTDTLKTSGKVAYWTESVKGASDALGQKGYVYGVTTTSDTLKNAASILVSQPFGVQASTELPGLIKGHSRNACSATTFMVGINVTTGYTGGAATLTVQGSGDGVNWTLVYTASASLASVIGSSGKDRRPADHLELEQDPAGPRSRWQSSPGEGSARWPRIPGWCFDRSTA